MDSPCLLLELSRVGERNVISRIGWSSLLPAQWNEKGKERLHVFSVAFYGALVRCARAEWRGSFELDEMYHFKIPMAKQFPH